MLLEPSLPSRVEREETLNTPLWVVIPVDPYLSSAMSVPGALACLRLVLQSLCDFIPPSGTLLDLSDWAFFVCR